MNRHVHALLFCRSSRNSARSLQAQEERCRRAALARGAETTTTIIDQGPTNTGLDRRAISELRSLLRAGTVDLVVADCPDRLSRRLADLRTLTQEVSRAGAVLIFVRM